MTRTGTARRKRKKRSIWFAPVAFIIICAALVFAMSVFFSVTSIVVEGSLAYTDEEIISASGVEEGDNLLFTNIFTATSRIKSKLPYVQDCSVEPKLPGTLIITVVETQAMAYLGSDGSYWVFDQNCKLLYAADGTEVAGLIRVKGIEPEAPVVGEPVDLGRDEAYKIAYLSDLLLALYARDMTGSVSEIDFTNGADPVFSYMDRFSVRLGTDSETGDKLDRLNNAIGQMTESDRGNIDLSLDEKVHFTPN